MVAKAKSLNVDLSLLASDSPAAKAMEGTGEDWPQGLKDWTSGGMQARVAVVPFLAKDPRRILVHPSSANSTYGVP